MTATGTRTAQAQARMLSKDGWAIGGQATTFSTGIAFQGPALPPPNTSVTCTWWAQADEQRLLLVARQRTLRRRQFGMADGGVRFISDTIDGNTFALAGQHGRRRADRRPEQVAARRPDGTQDISRRQFHCRLFFCRVARASSPRRGRRFCSAQDGCPHRCRFRQAMSAPRACCMPYTS